MTQRVTSWLAICLIFCLTAWLPAQDDAPADDGGGNLFTNPTFTDAAGDGVPAGWQRRTKDSGYVRTGSEGDVRFVSVGVDKAGEDSFIQQNVKLPEGTVKVTLWTKYRYENIEPGEKGHQKGVIQGRFTKAGKETGGWIDLAGLKGSGKDWAEASKTATVPEGADGLMLRLALYGVKSGRIDVAEVRAEVVTEADVAADRAKYRPAEPYGEPVSDARYARLTRGININNWFCQPWNIKVDGEKGKFDQRTVRGYITDHDLRLIKDAGFNHIRLPVDPVFLMDTATGDLKTELLPELDRAIGMIVEHDLAVIIDVHPKSPGFKKMNSKGDLPEKFVTWWGHLAKHLSATDPEMLFLELMNEPGGQGYWVNNWPAFQDRLIMTVRAAAPKHTIIGCGGAYMLIKELPKLVPHTDRNIVYAIHYYEPSPFTHQGAVWMKDWYRPLRNVPWPLVEETLEAARANVAAGDKATDKAKEALGGIVKSGWGSKEKIVEHLGEMVAWTKQHDRRLVIGEWGVYRKYAPRDARLAYLDFMTQEMAKAGIGWSKWDYCGGGFDIIENPEAPSVERKLDAEVVKALNLRPQTAAK